MPTLVGGFQGEREIISAESSAELEASPTDNARVVFVRVGLDIEHMAKKVEMGNDA